MKKLVCLFIIAFPFIQAHAGGGNGGGTMGLQMNSEIVFNQGEKDGITRFQYGIQQDKRWKIEEINIPTEDLKLDSTAMKALSQSAKSKNWVKLQ